MNYFLPNISSMISFWNIKLVNIHYVLACFSKPYLLHEYSQKLSRHSRPRSLTYNVIVLFVFGIVVLRWWLLWWSWFVSVLCSVPFQTRIAFATKLANAQRLTLRPRDDGWGWRWRRGRLLSPVPNLLQQSDPALQTHNGSVERLVVRLIHLHHPVQHHYAVVLLFGRHLHGSQTSSETNATLEQSPVRVDWTHSCNLSPTQFFIGVDLFILFLSP